MMSTETKLSGDARIILFYYSGWGYWQHITLGESGVKQVIREDAEHVRGYFKLPIEAELDAKHGGEATTSYLHFSERQPAKSIDPGPTLIFKDEVELHFILCDEPSEDEWIPLPQHNNENQSYRRRPISINEKTIKITKDQLILEQEADSLSKGSIAAEATTLSKDASINEVSIQVDKYSKRKISFDNWQAEAKVALDVITVLKIHSQVKQGSKHEDKSLWSCSPQTFRREFWQRYSRENGINKKPGRPTSG